MATTVNAINESIASTAAAGSAFLTAGGSNFEVNITISAGTPTGTITAKYLNNRSDTAANFPSFVTLPVTAGLFANGTSTVKLSNGTTVSSNIVGIYWLPSGTPAGAIVIKGRST